VQSEEEMEADVNRQIQVRWLQWRRGSSVLCETKVPLKKNGKFIGQLQEWHCYMNKVLDGEEPTREQNEYIGYENVVLNVLKD